MFLSQVVVGERFSFSIDHEAPYLFYFFNGNVCIVAWKSGNMLLKVKEVWGSVVLVSGLTITPSISKTTSRQDLLDSFLRKCSTLQMQMMRRIRRRRDIFSGRKRQTVKIAEY